jgi:phosphoglycolate phosphatase-like HAD superfamily hydrolase
LLPGDVIITGKPGGVGAKREAALVDLINKKRSGANKRPKVILDAYSHLPLVRPFSAVPDLLWCVRDAGLKVAIASSAKENELDKYLDIARIADLVDVTTSSEDVEQSKPAPDIFEAVLEKLGIEAGDAVAIGDTPYDASAAGKAGIATIGVLCGGFTEASLRETGCVDVYPGPAALFARFADTLLAR